MASLLSDLDDLLNDFDTCIGTMGTRVTSSKEPRSRAAQSSPSNITEDVAPVVEEAPLTEEKKEMKVDPWTCEGEIDYDKLLEQWGCDPVTPEQLERWERLTGSKPHPLIRRGVYYAQKDLDIILDCAESGEGFYLYTGRGPSSSSMHVGHMVPFVVCKYMQDAFNVPMVIEITDDEKFFWKDMTLEESLALAIENIKDIISFGFDVTKTFIFLDSQYMHYLYPNTCRVLKKVTVNKLMKIFGFEFEKFNEYNCGKFFYPSVQVVPSFASTFPIPLRGKQLRCIIPCAIDQNPYFVMTRQIAESLGEHKCANLYSKFIPGLGGLGKMSSSTGASIFLNDTPKAIRKKIASAVSGGQDDAALQREMGADLEKDVAYQYLTFFMEDDDELEEIGRAYSSGEMLTGEVKKKLGDVLIPLLSEIQYNRSLVTDEVLQAFMAVRPLVF